jgi:hypothetical protein
MSKTKDRLKALEEFCYEAIGEDVERLHQQVDMWAPRLLQDRVAEMEVKFALLTEVLIKSLELNSKHEDEDEDEYDEEDELLVKVDSVDTDPDLTVVKTHDQQLVLNDEELCHLQYAVNQWQEA